MINKYGDVTFVIDSLDLYWSTAKLSNKSVQVSLKGSVWIGSSLERWNSRQDKPLWDHPAPCNMTSSVWVQTRRSLSLHPFVQKHTVTLSHLRRAKRCTENSTYSLAWYLHWGNIKQRCQKRNLMCLHPQLSAVSQALHLSYTTAPSSPPPYFFFFVFIAFQMSQQQKCPLLALSHESMQWHHHHID